MAAAVNQNGTLKALDAIHVATAQALGGSDLTFVTFDKKQGKFANAHDATIASVVNGKVEAAALDITVWNKFVKEKRVDTKEVNVFYTTPGYFNYNWSVHADMPAALREKVTKALLDIDPATTQGKEILDLNRATRYIPTQAANYQGIEKAARSAGLLK